MHLWREEEVGRCSREVAGREEVCWGSWPRLKLLLSFHFLTHQIRYWF